MYPPLHSAGPADRTGFPTHPGLHPGVLPFGGTGTPAAEGRPPGGPATGAADPERPVGKAEHGIEKPVPG